MGLFSFLNKNKQEATAEDSGHYTRADDDAIAAQARSKRASSAGEPAARRAKSRTAPDPVLPEKKRARRRLVGAIALALAVAVGLPMVLDSEPKPLASDIDIQIPSKEKQAPVLAAPAPVVAADSLDQREQIIAPEAVSRDVAEVKLVMAKPDIKPEPKHEAKSEPKPVARPEPKPTEKPVAKPVAKAEEKSVVKPAEPSSDAARAQAILQGKSGAEQGNQKFVVQVAALASQEKVTELQERLKAAGIASFTQKVPTKEGARIRIRVGPFSKEEAEKVRAKLVKLGLAGSTVPA